MLYISWISAARYFLFQFHSIHCLHIFVNSIRLHVATHVWIALKLRGLSNIRSVAPSRRSDNIIAFTALMLRVSGISTIECVCSVGENNLKEI